MIYASCRKDFTDARHFSEATLTYRRDLSDDSSTIEPSTVPALVGVRPLILIHGYKTVAEDARQAYLLIETELVARAAGYSAVIGMLWPGSDITAAFPLAVVRADRAGKRLRELLRMLPPSTDIQTHSLGARVALKAVMDPQVKCRNLILSAPAVDDESLEPGGEFSDHPVTVGRAHVFYSRRDQVLEVAYRLGDFDDHDRALGWNGSQNPERLPSNARQIDCTEHVGEHGGYRHWGGYYDLWAAAAR